MAVEIIAITLLQWAMLEWFAPAIPRRICRQILVIDGTKKVAPALQPQIYVSPWKESLNSRYHALGP